MRITESQPTALMSKFKNISFRYGRRDVLDQECAYTISCQCIPKRPTDPCRAGVPVHRSNENVNLIALKIIIVIFDSMLARVLLPSIDSKKNKGAACDSIHTTS